jgi:hypothetical protein
MSRYESEKRRYQPTARRITSGSELPPLEKTATEEARRSIRPTYHGVTPKCATLPDQLRALKTFASADAVNTTTGPQLPKYISAAFGSLDKHWKPGYLRSAYGAICCHKFKPGNQTDDIFLAQILGHKLART